MDLEAFQPLLEEAVMANRTAAVMIMLKQMPHAALHICRKGRTLMHAACSHGQPSLEMVQCLLLFMSADTIGKQCSSGITALHLAVAKNRLDIVKLLYERNPQAASIKRPSDAKTPLFIALDYNFNDIADFFLTAQPTLIDDVHVANRNVLFTTTNIVMLQKLLTLRPQLIEDVDDWWNTPLHHAVQNHLSLRVPLLISMHPKLMQQTNKNGQTALDFAFQKQKSLMVNALLKHVPCFHFTDFGGNTTLHMAVRCCEYDVLCQVFAHNMTFLNTENFKKTTPFQKAVKSGNLSRFELFLPHVTIEMVAETKPFYAFNMIRSLIQKYFNSLDEILLPDLLAIVFNYLEL